MTDLPRDTQQLIVGLLKPKMETEADRRAILRTAFGINSPILDRINFAGPTDNFTIQLLFELVNYGEVAKGKQALWAVLEVIRGQVGFNIQNQIDRLRPKVEALTQIANARDYELANETQITDRANPANLLDLLIKYFDQGELKTLCFRLGVDYDMLQGEGKENKARELIQYFSNRNRLSELEGEITKQRPHISSEYIPRTVPLDQSHKTQPSKTPTQKVSSSVETERPIVQADISVDISATVIQDYLDSIKPVPLDNPSFFMASILVSNRLYFQFVNSEPSWKVFDGENANKFCDGKYLRHWQNGQPKSGDIDLPVTNICVYAAEAFTDWLSKQTTIDIRLPTFQEWNIAVRAGRPDWFVEEIEAGRVNFYSTSNKPMAVNDFEANPFGLHDLLGNAYDICFAKDGSITTYLLAGGCFHSTRAQLQANLEAPTKIESKTASIKNASFRCAYDTPKRMAVK